MTTETPSWFVRELVARKFALLQETIEVRRSKGFAAAAQVVMTDRGKDAMDSIRKLLGELKTTQVAAAATETAAAVTETTITVEEVKQSAQLAVQKAKYVAESAQRAAKVSEGGKHLL